MPRLFFVLAISEKVLIEAFVPFFVPFFVFLSRLLSLYYGKVLNLLFHIKEETGYDGSQF
jgi:hypothetical protein